MKLFLALMRMSRKEYRIEWTISSMHWSKILNYLQFILHWCNCERFRLIVKELLSFLEATPKSRRWKWCTLLILQIWGLPKCNVIWIRTNREISLCQCHSSNIFSNMVTRNCSFENSILLELLLFIISFRKEARKCKKKSQGKTVVIVFSQILNLTVPDLLWQHNDFHDVFNLLCSLELPFCC